MRTPFFTACLSSTHNVREADLSRPIAQKLLTLQKGSAPATFTPKRLTIRGTGLAGDNEQRNTDD